MTTMKKTTTRKMDRAPVGGVIHLRRGSVDNLREFAPAGGDAHVIRALGLKTRKKKDYSHKVLAFCFHNRLRPAQRPPGSGI